MNFTPLKYIYQPSGKAGANTLLLLHGTGGDENDLLSIGEKFGSDINILSLRGNVSESGMPRFFKRIAMGVFDEEDVKFRTHEMVAFIKQLAIKENFDVQKLIALGYSNGANIAGSTLLLYPDFFAGAIMYRPMQPFKIIEPLNISKPIPVFMSSGANDFTVSQEATQAYVQQLKSAGFEVADHTLFTGHNLVAQDISLSVQWYRQHFSLAVQDVV